MIGLLKKKLFVLLMLLICNVSMLYAADMYTDIVVVGAGTSGTSAALSALENGAKTVLIDKAPFPAGAGTFSGGMFAADSSQQKKLGKTVDKKWLYEKYMNESNYHANSKLVMNIINNAGRAVDFINRNGANMSLVDAGTGGQYWHKDAPSTLHGYQNGGGAKNIGNLQATFKKKGGTLLFETKALSLITDNGKVVGVKAEDADGEKIDIHAKAVIMATGGMGANSEMLKAYFHDQNPPLSLVAMAQGDGLRMAWAAGAQKGRILMQAFAANLTPSAPLSLQLRPLLDAPFLGVNNFGKRFMREDMKTEYAIAGNAIYEQPDHQAWVIIDQGTLDKIAKNGMAPLFDQYSKWKNSKIEFYEFNERIEVAKLAKEYSSPMNFAPVLKKLEGKDVVVADTIEELAKKMHADPAVLASEVERYNSLAASGKDVDFFNAPKFMYPVKKGPFYAIHEVTRSIGALGGIVVNENLQALNDDDKPVDGLYAVGNDATGMYGNSYVELEGGTLGFGFTSGMLAGENAAKAVK